MQSNYLCLLCFNHSVMWTICLSSLSLLVLKAGIVQSIQTGQCMFKPDNVAALQQAFIAMCWNQIVFFLSQSTQIKQLMCWKLTFWKHYGKFSCEDFNTLHVCFSFFCICADTSTHPFTFAWIFNKVADVTLGEGMLKLYSGNSRYQFFLHCSI